MNLYDRSNFIKTETELSGDRKCDISITLEDGSQGSVVLGQELNSSLDFNQPPDWARTLAPLEVWFCRADLEAAPSRSGSRMFLRPLNNSAGYLIPYKKIPFCLE